MTNFVVKVMQLFLGPEIQQIIILIIMSVCSYSCYGKL